MTQNTERDKPVVGLILSGGGARAAYQVGVLKAIATMLPEGAPNPFPVICGSSAGAINAAALAIYATRFHEGVHRLVHVWRNFRVDQVFRADARGILLNGLRWGAALLFLGGLGRRNPHALLDRAPLRRLLQARLPCERIRDAIGAGALRALSITCSGYGSGQSVTFYQGVGTIAPWNRVRRIGCPAAITYDHLMASSALPLIFAAEKINREYFGDGSMRQASPLSPALHLGAERVLVIGLRQETKAAPVRENGGEYPPLAQIAGHVLNSIFLDSLDADIERLRRINRTVAMIPPAQRERGEFASAGRGRAGDIAESGAGKNRRTARPPSAARGAFPAARCRRRQSPRRQLGELPAVRKILLPRPDRARLCRRDDASRGDSAVSRRGGGQLI